MPTHVSLPSSHSKGIRTPRMHRYSNISHIAWSPWLRGSECGSAELVTKEPEEGLTELIYFAVPLTTLAVDEEARHHTNPKPSSPETLTPLKPDL